MVGRGYSFLTDSQTTDRVLYAILKPPQPNLRNSRKVQKGALGLTHTLQNRTECAELDPHNLLISTNAYVMLHVSLESMRLEIVLKCSRPGSRTHMHVS